MDAAAGVELDERPLNRQLRNLLGHRPHPLHIGAEIGVRLLLQGGRLGARLQRQLRRRQPVTGWSWRVRLQKTVVQMSLRGHAVAKATQEAMRRRSLRKGLLVDRCGLRRLRPEDLHGCRNGQKQHRHRGNPGSGQQLPGLWLLLSALEAQGTSASGLDHVRKARKAGTSIVPAKRVAPAMAFSTNRRQTYM